MKKLYFFISITLIVAFLAFILIACNNFGADKLDEDSYDWAIGKYYLESPDQTYDESVWLELLGDKEWKDSNGSFGTFEINGKFINFSYSHGQDALSGTISDRYISRDGNTYRKGPIPNTSNPTDNLPIGQPIIEKLEGGRIDGFNLYMEVGTDESSKIELFRKIKTKEGRWYIYSDAELQTKISDDITLQDGDNTFYIQVLTNDGEKNKYTLHIFKSYYVTITYESEGITYQTKQVEVNSPLEAGPDITPRKGYTFNGWGSKDKEGLPVTESMTFTASWAANQYTITLDPKGGKVDTTSVVVTTNEEFYFPIAYGKEENVFVGWVSSSGTLYANKNGKGRWPASSDNDMTLYAEWQVNKYRVNLAQNIEEAGFVSGAGNKEYNSEVTITAIKKPGYEFIGWYEGETEIAKERIYTFNMPNVNKTFEARWEIGTYAITLDALGGDIPENVVYVKYNSEYVLPTPAATAATEGLEFSCWRDYSGRIIDSSGIWEYENANLQADWMALPYSITYELNGGIVDGKNPDKYTVRDNIELINPTKRGYTFTGWTGTNLSAKTKVVEITNGVGERTYTAHFEPTVCMVTFDVRGGNSVPSQEMVSGDSISGIKSFPVPTHDNTNLKFTGWYTHATEGEKITDSDGKGLYYWVGDYTIAEEKSWVCDTTETTVYARWVDTSIQFTYKRIDVAGNDDPVGDYVLFGEWPQTVKDANVKVSTIQDSRNYYLGDDDNYYAKIVAKPAYYSNNYNKFSDGSTITRDSIYFFKVEPIKWSVHYGSTLICASIIDYRNFGATNNYENSAIRAWLSGKTVYGLSDDSGWFLNTAFTLNQRKKIQSNNIDNSSESTGFNAGTNPYACENTLGDRVFLLSHKEAIDQKYNINSLPARKRVTSDYTRALGIFTDQYDKTGDWWLRSPDWNTNYKVQAIGTDGSIVSGAYPPQTTSQQGVVPALWLNW